MTSVIANWPQFVVQFSKIRPSCCVVTNEVKLQIVVSPATFKALGNPMANLLFIVYKNYHTFNLLNLMSAFQFFGGPVSRLPRDPSPLQSEFPSFLLPPPSPPPFSFSSPPPPPPCSPHSFLQPSAVLLSWCGQEWDFNCLSVVGIS